jgi:hypothetical protein
MDWSVVSLVKQTSDESEEVITGAEGRTGPSRALTSASKKVSTLALPYGYRLRWLERRTMMKSRWKYGLAVATNLILRHFWIVAAVPDAREGMALGAEAWVTVVALVELLPRGKRARHQLRYVPRHARGASAVPRRRAHGRRGGRGGSFDERESGGAG